MGRQVRQQGIHLSYTLPRFKNVAVPGDNSRHLLGTRIKNSVTKGDAKHKLYTTHNKTSAGGRDISEDSTEPVDGPEDRP